MHSLLHLFTEFVFLIVTAVLFTVLVIKRPNAALVRLSRYRLVGLLVVGLIVGVAFLSTSHLYATSQ